jgi:hypothetical protein
MGFKIRPARGVIWYPISESLWLAVTPGRSSPEKCLLLQHHEMDLLDRLNIPSGVSEQELSPGEIHLVKNGLPPSPAFWKRFRSINPWMVT